MQHETRANLNGMTYHSQSGWGNVASFPEFVANTFVGNASLFLVILGGTYFVTPVLIPYLPGSNVALQVAFLAGTYAIFSNSGAKLIGY